MTYENEDGIVWADEVGRAMEPVAEAAEVNSNPFGTSFSRLMARNI